MFFAWEVKRRGQKTILFSHLSGIGTKAKLQHPLGVCWDPVRQRVFVADSYNNKIKIVDPFAKKCETFWPTASSNETLKEPGGIAFRSGGGGGGAGGGGMLLIADTNNHQILSLDIETKRSKKIELLHEEKLPTDFPLQLPKRGVKEFQLDEAVIVVKNMAGKPLVVEVDFCLKLNEGIKQTEDVTSFWFASIENQNEDSPLSIIDYRGVIALRPKRKKWRKRIPLRMSVQKSQGDIHTSMCLKYVMFYCHAVDGTCAFEAVNLTIPIVIRESLDATDDVKVVRVTRSVPS